ncbi:MAG: hypothetical protein ABIC91_05115 [Nanoarchaeota archaeon]|nr:hypothetical protein [Nanoarchaeota archaeon]MBU1031181.1 hypothetical protein [Nanoarchaeota archaeon]MBU1850657.1 hypothetical protein [Nanoarchaeota archaeon]
MDKINLKEWTVYYVKNKDLINRKLKSFDESSDRINFHFKDFDHTYYIRETLNSDVFDISNIHGKKSIVCLASRENLDFLIKHWNEFKTFQDSSLIFVDLSSNNKWLINPFVHNKICDEESLVMGLKTMFENTFTL